MMIRPLPRPVPLRQSVYDALIDLIVGGELRPGQHLVETELAGQLGVSRQPIREALHRMEAEGWVDLRPSQGAFVHVPTDAEVNELLDVRALLEAETARLAARATSPDPVRLARLREICQEGRAASEAADFNAAVTANSEFHAEIAAIGGNGVLAELADIVGRRVQWYYRMVSPARAHGSWTEHAGREPFPGGRGAPADQLTARLRRPARVGHRYTQPFGSSGPRRRRLPSRYAACRPGGPLCAPKVPARCRVAGPRGALEVPGSNAYGSLLLSVM